MAIIEQMGRMTYIDANGDQHILYPTTKKECVEGFPAIESFIGNSSKLNTSNKTTLVAAINEVLSKTSDSGESGTDYADIAAAIESALKDAKNSGEFDGRGIVSIYRTSGNGSAGSVDTYTIKYTDESTSTFTVYNGKNGVGEGTSGGSGENGATFTPSIDSECNLSWSNDKGLPNPQTVNIRGKDGKNGITPQKNVDYFDGVSPIVTTKKVSGGYELSITDTSGTKSFVIKDGVQGGKGDNGISATHSWNGTTLTITSASGTSSANLKGDPGNTPIAGIDYYTDEEKNSLIAEIQKNLLNGELKGIEFVTIDTNTGKASHNPTEIKAIISSGKIPFSYSNIDDVSWIMPLSYLKNNLAVFSTSYFYANDTNESWKILGEVTVCVNPDKSVTNYKDSYVDSQIIPPASKNDPGKYLKVTDDAIVWDYLPELPTLFTYGQDDLEAGVSALETGKLYFVYE